MLKNHSTKRFKKDLQRMQKRNKDMQQIYATIERLRIQKLLPQDEDHALKGEYLGCRECHVLADWVLVYEIQNDILILRRTGTHQDIFKKRY